jgi:uncharacterized protein (DUF1501 family)
MAKPDAEHHGSDRLGRTDRRQDEYTIQSGRTCPYNCFIERGRSVLQWNIASPVSVAVTGPVAAACSVQSYCNSRQQTAQQFSALSSGVSPVQADNRITNNAFTYNATLTDALGSVTAPKTVFPTSMNPFGAQLQEVSRLIQVRAALGVTRQMFFLGAGSFDTYGNQLVEQTTLLSQLSRALGAFYQALEERI